MRLETVLLRMVLSKYLKYFLKVLNLKCLFLNTQNSSIVYIANVTRFPDGVSVLVLEMSSVKNKPTPTDMS